MKRLFAVIVSVGLMLFGAAHLALSQSNVSSIRPDQVNEAAIRKLYSEFTTAWNRHDPAAMAKLWTIDGDHLDPDGRMVKGRDELIGLFTKQHTTVFKSTVLDLDIDAVWFVTGSMALVDGSYALVGATDPKGNPLPVRKGHLTSVLLHEGGGWSIAASRLMIPAPLPWRDE